MAIFVFLLVYMPQHWQCILIFFVYTPAYVQQGKCTKGSPTTSSIEMSKNVAVNDLLFGICKELLYRPVVLNCGHSKCSKNS